MTPATDTYFFPEKKKQFRLWYHLFLDPCHWHLPQISETERKTNSNSGTDQWWFFYFTSDLYLKCAACGQMQLWNSILGRGAKWRMMMMIRRRGVTFPGTLAVAELLLQYLRLPARALFHSWWWSHYWWWFKCKYIYESNIWNQNWYDKVILNWSSN